MPPNNRNLTLEQIQDLIIQEDNKFLSIVAALQSGRIPSEISNATPSTTSSRTQPQCYSGVENVTQIITLQPDTVNTISFNTIPDNLSIDSVFYGLDILLVVNDDGEYYIPGSEVNTIGNLNLNQGYLVYINSSTPQDLIITGCPVDTETLDIVIKPMMMNYLPYGGNIPTTTEEYFGPYDDIILFANSAEGYYVPNFNVDNMIDVYPGRGYNVFADNLDSEFQFTTPISATDTDAFVLTPGDEIVVEIRNFFQCYDGGGYILGACGYRHMTGADNTISTYDLSYLADIIINIPGTPTYKSECDIQGNGIISGHDTQLLTNFLTEFNDTGVIPQIPGNGIHEGFNIGDCVKFLTDDNVVPPQPTQCGLVCNAFECEYCNNPRILEEYIPCCIKCCADVVYGCTYQLAINYNPRATDDNGSCVFEVNQEEEEDEVIILGCVDLSACNYNPYADSSSDPIIYCDYGRSCWDGSTICPGEFCPEPAEELPPVDLNESITLDDIRITDKILSFRFEITDIDEYNDLNQSININWGASQFSESFTTITDSTQIASYTYEDYGSYTIKVELYNDGTLNDTVSFDVNIAEFLPDVPDYVQINALRILENRLVQLDVTYIDDDGDFFQNIELLWGDTFGVPITTNIPANQLLTFEHQYVDWGTYTISLTSADGETTEIIIPLTEDLIEFDGDWIYGGNWNYIANTLPPSTDLLCTSTRLDGTSADLDCAGQEVGDGCATEFGTIDFGECRPYPTTRTIKASMYVSCDSTELLDNPTIETYLANSLIRTYQYDSDNLAYQAGTSFYDSDSGIFNSGGGIVYLDVGKGYIFKNLSENNFCLKLTKPDVVYD